MLVGCSIGGWIAAEMATKAPERFEKLALVGAGRRQDRPLRQARHSRHLRHVAGGDGPAAVPRSRRKRSSISSKLQRRGDARHRAQQRDPRAAGLGALHAQSQAQASAPSPDHAGAVPARRERRARLGGLSRSLREARARRADRDHRRSRPSAADRAARGFRRENRWRFLGPDRDREPDRHARLAFQRERLSLPAAGRGIRLDPRHPAEPALRSEERRRALRPLPHEWQIAEEEGVNIMLNEHHQTRDLRRSRGAAGARRAGARSPQGAAPDPRQSDRQPPPAGARRRRDGADRRAVERPARGGLRARRADRGPAGEQQSGAHERAPLGSARPHRPGLDQP